MGSATNNKNSTQTLSAREWVRLAFIYLLHPLILWLCGRDAGWWQAWVFSLLVMLAGIGGRLWAEKRHPGLLAERNTAAAAADIKPWDKILAPLMALSISFPLIIVAGLDHRYGWSLEFPTWLTILGLLLIAVGYGFGAWAMAENRFFSGVVRIQSERGHAVCESGPYQFVRHAGYAGNMLSLPGIVLALGSLWAILPAVVALVITLVRTSLEDRTLQAELPGYAEYAQRVRYRLIPGIF